MPYAFKNAGIILGSICLWLVALICIHCMHILVNCYKHTLENYKHKDDDKKLAEKVGYDDVVFIGIKDNFKPDSKIPKYLKRIVSFLIILNTLGGCCLYMVFITRNLKEVINFYEPNNKMNIRLLMAIISVPLALFCFIKNLKILAPFTTLANILMVTSLCVILGYLFLNGSWKPINELELAAPFYNWPYFFSAVVLFFDGIFMVIPVYQAMSDKSAFTPCCGMLNISMVLVGVIYFVFGLLGYLHYGNGVLASITLNLPVSDVSRMHKILFFVTRLLNKVKSLI
jgi:proton-coupled amino acid transporter